MTIDSKTGGKPVKGTIYVTGVTRLQLDRHPKKANDTQFDLSEARSPLEQFIFSLEGEVAILDLEHGTEATDLIGSTGIVSKPFQLDQQLTKLEEAVGQCKATPNAIWLGKITLRALSACESACDSPSPKGPLPKAKFGFTDAFREAIITVAKDRRDNCKPASTTAVKRSVKRSVEGYPYGDGLVFAVTKLT